MLCLIAFDAHAAPPPSQLGPEVAITRPRDGYVGRLNVTPENGPAGTEVTVTADQLPPNQELALVWRTVKGNWKVDGPEYHGREFKTVGYEIAKVADPDQQMELAERVARGEAGREQIRGRTVKAPRPKRWSCKLEDGAQITVTIPGVITPPRLPRTEQAAPIPSPSTSTGNDRNTSTARIATVSVQPR